MSARWTLLCLVLGACEHAKSEHKTSDSASMQTTNATDDSAQSSDSGDAGAAEDNCVSAINPSPITVKNCVRQAACRWDGNQDDASFGHTAHVGGDIDGDGLADWVVGAPYEDASTREGTTSIDAGLVHIFRGSQRTETSPGTAQLMGSTTDANLGYATIIVPDLNGDGMDEVVAGGRGTHTTEMMGVGEVQILFGKSEGWDEPMQTADVLWLGEQEMARAGSTLAGLGDINGDGFGELAVATNQKQATVSGYEQRSSGTVALFLGREDFSSYAELRDASAAISGTGLNDLAGHAITAGDLNADGYNDLIIGAPYGNSNHGRVVVFAGGPTPIRGDATIDDAPIHYAGSQYGDAYGWSVATGDLNNDGHHELIVGAPKADDATPDSGTVHIMRGGPGFFDAPSDVAHRITGEWDDHNLGSSLLAGIDINGDGSEDLLMGAIGAWHGLVTKGGRVYAVKGPIDDWPSITTAATSDLQFLGGATKDYLGNSIGAHDINGDGKTDIMLSSGYADTQDHIDAGSVYLFWGE